MNPLTPTLAQALHQARSLGLERIDAQLLLLHALARPDAGRAWLLAHDTDALEANVHDQFIAMCQRRAAGEPVAYLTGHKEFYGHIFSITPQVLVPRPESEEMLSLLREYLGETETLPGMTTRRLVDIGTGSGCLGISAKLLYPELDATLLDTSKPALSVAEKNARALGADVAVQQSDLLQSYPFSPDIVLSILPYVDKAWASNSPELQHEPAEALFAEKDGLALIEKCFQELSHRMKPGGVAIFEADPRQWPAIEKIASAAGFHNAKQSDYAALFIYS